MYYVRYYEGRDSVCIWVCGMGYTRDLSKADKFTKELAEELCSKYIDFVAYECEKVDNDPRLMRCLFREHLWCHDADIGHGLGETYR